MKNFFKSSVMTALMFALAILLLSVGTIGGTQAALQRESNLYQGQISMKNIGVTLYESTNGGESWEEITHRNYDKVDANGKWDLKPGVLIKNMVKDAGDNALKIGKTYDFALKVINSGSINQYTRVTIYKYFVDASGNRITPDQANCGWFDGNGIKQMNIDPLSLITIELDNTSNWIKDNDESSNTSERTVLYYDGILGCSGNTEGYPTETPPFTKSLTVSSDLTKYFINTTGDDGSSTGNYIYVGDGLGIVVEVQVDSVQTRHPDEAKTSAWGRVG